MRQNDNNEVHLGGKNRNKREKMIKEKIVSTKIKILQTKMELSKCSVQIREMKEELSEINERVAEREAQIRKLKSKAGNSLNLFVTIKKESYNCGKLIKMSQLQAGKIEAKKRKMKQLTSKYCVLAAKLPDGETQQPDDADASDANFVPTPAIFYPLRKLDATSYNDKVNARTSKCELTVSNAEADRTEVHLTEHNPGLNHFKENDSPKLKDKETEDLSILTITSENLKL